MTQLEPKKAILLIIIGILLIAIPQIISHYIEVPDFVNGLCKGAGIGILVISIINLARIRKVTSS